MGHPRVVWATRQCPRKLRLGTSRLTTDGPCRPLHRLPNDSATLASRLAKEKPCEEFCPLCCCVWSLCPCFPRTSRPPTILSAPSTSAVMKGPRGSCCVPPRRCPRRTTTSSL